MTCGLMGGTFDPVHLGHVQIATNALDELKLDRLLFLPDGDPPHKRPIASGVQRLEMLRLICLEDSRFEVTDMELRRRGTTYTVDTLRKLKELRPRDELIYLIGSDTLYLFPTWHTAQDVAKLCRMAVVLRPGDDLTGVINMQQELLQNYGLYSCLLSKPGLPISSSMVRDALQNGESIRKLVPALVADYIEEERLYQVAAKAAEIKD
ncbi:MAG: nicotinate (nicotinamide) nucleotide adenylyltransferase [Clostridiales bacterium]|nr:nicotinate (nicotinamide) nucleotide adenylyltransferase [Clostridiales bacterium]